MCFYSSSLQESSYFGVSGKQAKEKNGELWNVVRAVFLLSISIDKTKQKKDYLHAK